MNYLMEQLLEKVWGYDYFGGARTVDVHVRRLRAKLGDKRKNWINDIFETKLTKNIRVKVVY